MSVDVHYQLRIINKQISLYKMYRSKYKEIVFNIHKYSIVTVTVYGVSVMIYNYKTETK